MITKIYLQIVLNQFLHFSLNSQNIVQIFLLSSQIQSYLLIQLNLVSILVFTLILQLINLIVIEKIKNLIKGKKNYKNKTKVKLFQNLLHAEATDCIVLSYLVSYFEKVSFKMKTQIIVNRIFETTKAIKMKI